MITNKKEFKEYMTADINAAYIPKGRISRFLHTLHGNEQCHAYRYVRCLRLTELYLNTHHILFYHLYRWKLSLLGIKYGIRININVTGKGLNIIHLAGGGGCIVNVLSMGDHCRLQSGVVIGSVGDAEHRPIIGNHVSFGLGCKVYGKITIGDNVKVFLMRLLQKMYLPTVLLAVCLRK